MKALTEKERRARLGVLVTLPEAARLLREFHPKYARSEYALRRMCIARKIPCSVEPRCGLLRPTSFRVVVRRLVERFDSWAADACN